MYINNEDFEIWMQKLSKKLSEIGQDLKSLINTKEVFDPIHLQKHLQIHLQTREIDERLPAKERHMNGRSFGTSISG